MILMQFKSETGTCQASVTLYLLSTERQMFIYQHKEKHQPRRQQQLYS